MKGDYRWLRDHKDPIIDLLRTEMQRQGGQNLPPEFLDQVAYKSGIHPQTIRAWLFGDTRHPQNLTVRFVWEALGCHVQIVREDGTEVKSKKG